LEIEKRKVKKVGEDEVATGRLQGKPAVQTCLTGFGNGVVTEQAFFQLTIVKPELNGRQQLERIVGLRQNRSHQCLLVSLIAPHGNLPIPIYFPYG
jgi:hypothetical protein